MEGKEPQRRLDFANNGDLPQRLVHGLVWFDIFVEPQPWFETK